MTDSDRAPYVELPESDIRLATPWPFLLLVVGWSWLFWIPVLLLDWNMRALPGSLLVAAGGISPILAALILNWLHETRALRRDFWRRTLDPRRISPPWLLVIILVPAGTAAAAVAAGTLAGGPTPDWQELLRFVHDPARSLLLIVFFLLFGPIPEEPGWRGYALDRLVARYDKIAASLILGLVWSVWHLPMFYIGGSLLARRFEPGTLLFWLGWFVPVLGRTVIFTWVFYGTGRSILAVILLHFLFNLVAELVQLPPAMVLWRSCFEVLFAVVIVCRWWRSGRHGSG